MEELSVVDALVQLSFRVQGVLADAGAAHDLSMTQLRLIGVLRDRTPGMQELAGHLGLDKSSVTGLVDRAEARGLVRRRSSAHDGRAVTVSLTPSGRRIGVAILARVTTAITALVEPLTAAQERDLVKLVGRLLAAGAPD
jgi:DNA-binding MarR family transcriptional regulator